MRLVGRFTLTLAALASLPAVVWAQKVNTGPRATAQSGAVFGQPRLTPPDEVEGTWVSDAPSAVPEPLPPGPMSGAPLGGGDPTSQYAGETYGDSDAYLHGDCPDGDCDPYGGHGHGGKGGHKHHKKGALWCGDIWNEVHSHRRFWVKPEALSMYPKGNPLPPLVTTSPVGTPQDQAGVLPVSATTEILFGNQNVDEDRVNGGKLSFGWWLVDGEFIGVEGHYFMLEQGGTDFSATSTFSDGIQPGDIILARPFFNVETDAQDSALLAFPGFSIGGVLVDLDGSIDINTTSNLQSAGILLTNLLWIDFTANYRIDLLGGYRYFRLEDSVSIVDSFITSGGVLAQTQFDSNDNFATKNEFHGGEFGIKGQIHRGRFSAGFMTKVALGSIRQIMEINGSNSVTTLPGTPQAVTVTNVGGLLTQPSNIGRFTNDEFAVMPEASLSLNFDITCNWRATLGYNFMYLDTVMRSGSAIDTRLNPTQINGGTLVGEPLPAPTFADSSYWLHGINAGLEFRY